MYRPIKTLDDCRLLQHDLDALEQWEHTWQMSFRPDKCKLIRFTRSHSPITFNYSLHNQHLSPVPSHKYLGIHLSSDLRFNTHIDHIRSKANRTLGFVRRNLHSCTLDIKHVAYNTLVRPTLEYCSAVWDPYTQTNITKLEQINTKAARFITHNYSLAPGTRTLIKQQINMDSLNTRRQAHRLTLMYKISNNHIDINKHEYLQDTNIRSTRNSHTQKYQTYHTNTDSYKHSYFPLTIRDWNRLPQHTIDSPTIDTFHNRVHDYLIRQAHTHA